MTRTTQTASHWGVYAPLSRAAKIAGREPILLNSADARDRGLREGDVVRVYKDRGAFLAGVAIAGSDTLLPGVAQIATGAWYDPLTPGTRRTGQARQSECRHLDKGTSLLAQGSAAQTCLVEIERYDDPPEVTAFDPPPMS